MANLMKRKEIKEVMELKGSSEKLLQPLLEISGLCRKLPKKT
jgi:hypothetical protein